MMPLSGMMQLATATPSPTSMPSTAEILRGRLLLSFMASAPVVNRITALVVVLARRVVEGSLGFVTGARRRGGLRVVPDLVLLAGERREALVVFPLEFTAAIGPVPCRVRLALGPALQLSLFAELEGAA